MVKILMLTGDAGEAQEIYYAKFRLEEEGWQVQIAAPEKRVFLSVVHDFEPGFDTYTEKPGYRVTADLALDDVAPEGFDGLVLPGGRAPEYLRNRPKAVSIVRHFLEARKPIAANCHGPLLAPGGRGSERHDDDVLSRSGAGPAGRRSAVRQSGRGRGRSAGHGPGLAGQRAMDEGIRSADEGREVVDANENQNGC